MTRFENRNWFTFAIENPAEGLLKTMKCVEELCKCDQIRACEVIIDQCHFGKFRSGERMLNFKKPTILITNNPGIIYAFGTKDKRWYPDAPDPKFRCTQWCPCDSFGSKHPSTETSNHQNGGTHASHLAPYPEALSCAVALHVNNWWRSNEAEAHLG